MSPLAFPARQDRARKHHRGSAGIRGLDFLERSFVAITQTRSRHRRCQKMQQSLWTLKRSPSDAKFCRELKAFLRSFKFNICRFKSFHPSLDNCIYIQLSYFTEKAVFACVRPIKEGTVCSYSSCIREDLILAGTVAAAEPSGPIARVGIAPCFSPVKSGATTAIWRLSGSSPEAIGDPRRGRGTAHG